MKAFAQLSISASLWLLAPLLLGTVTIPLPFMVELAIAQEESVDDQGAEEAISARNTTELIEEGTRLFYRGQYSEALAVLQQAVELSQQQADPVAEAWAWRAIALLHLTRDDRLIPALQTSFAGKDASYRNHSSFFLSK